MKRKRRNRKREKMIMLCSSVFVLTLLTLTGVYVKEKNHQIQEDYVVDLSLLDEQEIAKTEQKEELTEAEEMAPVTSKKVENDNKLREDKDTSTDLAKVEKRESAIVLIEGTKEEKKEEKVLEFGEDEQLLWPVVGNILIDYSMDKPVYFSSLQQYKYHPAIVIKAVEGQNITAAADGRIIGVEKDDQLGNVITMNLGDGYEVSYGQLTNIQVKVGDTVEQGAYLADVASPTKFYSVEGCNVYFSLKKDGVPINPMERLK